MGHEDTTAKNKQVSFVKKNKKGLKPTRFGLSLRPDDKPGFDIKSGFSFADDNGIAVPDHR